MESCVNREEKRKLEREIKKTKFRDTLNILWVSNAPYASTGYGTQSAQVVKRLAKIKQNVAIATNYGLEASHTYYAVDDVNIKMYPRGHDQWSNDVIPAHMYDHSLDHPENLNLILTLFDVWVFKGPKWKEFPVASWVPVDHMPTPPGVVKWLNQDFVLPIAMSKYGQKVLKSENIESLYIPHAIEKVFKPTSTVSNKTETYTGREIMGLPEDAFVVGMNAANKGVSPNRKAFGENLLAFSIFAKDKKDVFLYLHTEPKGSLGGIDLFELLQAVGIEKEKVRFADTYALRSGMSQEAMAALYTSMDVLLATSYGEGFGIPTIEAQATGTKVIVSNFAASAELCGDGWLIEGQPLWDAAQGSFFYIPSIPQISSALDEAYNQGRTRSQKAIDFAAQYDADLVFETAWKPALKALKEHAIEHQTNRLKSS